jgi:hypothetical protein
MTKKLKRKIKIKKPTLIASVLLIAAMMMNAQDGNQGYDPHFSNHLKS